MKSHKIQKKQKADTTNKPFKDTLLIKLIPLRSTYPIHHTIMMKNIFAILSILAIAEARRSPCDLSKPSMGVHRAGWGLDEPCASFLADYNAINTIKEVKDVKKVVPNNIDKPEEGTHMKDVEAIIGFE